MQTILLSHEEVGRRARNLYEKEIREQVETEENIGKMIVIDIESGDYEIDEKGLEASKRLHEKNPYARLYGIKIGYEVAVAFGGSSLGRIRR